MREDFEGGPAGAPAASHGATWDESTAGWFVYEPISLYDHGSSESIPFNYDRDLRMDFASFQDGAANDQLTIRELTAAPAGSAHPWNAPAVRSYDFCPGANTRKLLLADLDGNGVSDLIYHCIYPDSTSTWQYRLHNGAYGDYSPVSSFSCTADPTMVRVLDFDGDGRHELLVPSGAYYHALHFEHDEGTLLSSKTNIPVEHPAIFLDVNGDGLPDVITLERPHPDSIANVPKLRMNIGGTLADPVLALPSDDPDYWIWTRRDHYPTSDPPLVASDIRVADLNADGRDDFIALFEVEFSLGSDPPVEQCDPNNPDRCVRQSETGLMLAHSSAGDRFYTVRMGAAGLASLGGTRRWPTTQIIDLGGDGLPDLALSLPQYHDPARFGHADLHVRQNAIRVVPGLLSAVTHRSDSGDETPSIAEFTYSHVSLPDGACEYPVRCANDGVHAVRSHRDALGRLFTHWYRGPRVDLRSGQSLGFSSHYVVNEGTGGVTETRFDNDTDFQASGAGIALAGFPTTRISYAPIQNVSGDAYRVQVEGYKYRVASMSSVHHAVLLDHRTVTVYETSTVSGGCEPVTDQLGCDDYCRVCQPIEVVHGSIVRSTETGLAYDNRLSLVEIVERVPGLQTDRTTITPEHRSSDWLIGLPTRIEVQSTA